MLIHIGCARRQLHRFFKRAHRVLIARLEGVLRAGDGVAFMNELSASANRDRARDFIGSELLPGANRAVIQERDRQPLLR